MSAPSAYKTPLQIKELTEVLIKHYKIKTGKYNLFVEFNIGSGVIGPNAELSGPGIMAGISKIGLTEAQDNDIGPNTVDASKLK